MKILLALALILSSLQVSAQVNGGAAPRSCDFEDYQKITAALSNEEIRTGSELKASLQGLLAQEMGPSCLKAPQVFGFGISENKSDTYIIEGNSQKYTVKITKSLEENKTYVNISLE